MKFRDNYCLITGSAGLLGKQHAIAALSIGIPVIISDLNIIALSLLYDELKTINSESEIIPLKMDVTNPEEVKEISKEVLKNYGQIKYLINNAAIDSKVDSLGNVVDSHIENFTIDRWNAEIAVGLTGAFICSKVFGSLMAKEKTGVIVNIASDLSVIAPDHRIYGEDNNLEFISDHPVKPITYSVIKTGLIGLTRYFATYWCDKGVRVNAISPGGVYTNQNGKFVSNISKLIPLNRMARIDEYRGAVKFLLSEDSSYMTGQNLVIDGGRSVW